MARQSSKWVIVFEFNDGTTKSYQGIRPRGIIDSTGKRPAYAELAWTGNKCLSETELFTVKQLVYSDISAALSPGYIQGRVRIKPLWLHNLINNRP